MSAAAEKIHELPNDWFKTTLGELVEYVTSGSRDWKKFYADKGSAFIRTQNIKTYKLDLDDVAYVDLPEKVEGKRTRVFKDDLLITITGANVGKVAHVNKEIEEAYVSQSVALVRLKNKDMAPYLYYHLRTRDGSSSQLESLAYGMGRPVLNLNNIKEVQINLAPPERQKRIVAKIEELFSHIDAGIEALKKAKQLLKQYRQSVLKAAVTGELTKEWREANKGKLEPASQLLERILKERRQKWEQQQLEQFKAKGKIPKDDKWKEKYNEPVVLRDPENQKVPDEWLQVSLDQVADVISGFAFKSKDFTNSGIAAIKIANVSYGAFVWKQQQFLPLEYLEKYNDFIISPNDVLLALTRPITNNNVKACLFPNDAEPALLNQRVCTIKNEKYLLKDYLLQVLQSEPFKNQIKAGMSETLQPNLSPTDLKSFLFGLPTLEEQEEIVRIVGEKLGIADRVFMELNSQNVKADKNKQSILASAFSGVIN